MSSDKEFSVSTDARTLVSAIIENNNWDPILGIKYFPGSQTGDGYTTKHIAVEITTSKEKIRLFIKCALDTNLAVIQSIVKFYPNERYFYDIVYPAYTEFLWKKKVEDCFRNVPKCYSTSSENVIALENIKYKGFALFDRMKIMGDMHIRLVLRTIAKFHAVSFAFKDQDREQYDKLVENCAGDFYSQQPEDSPILTLFYEIIKEALNKLDPENDKEILQKCDANALIGYVTSTTKSHNEYADEDMMNPIDIMIVDWQLFRSSSVVYDISHFFYTTAAEESLSKLQDYLEVYYAELSSEMKKLGSKPEILYPREIFEEEWRTLSKYGFTIAIVILKFMLSNQDEVLQIDKIDFDKTKEVELFKKFDNEDAYIKRVKTLAQFMVDKGYI
ncbi:hypothetical protein Trydic_g19646 [Trypoxylus dichotomus]